MAGKQICKLKFANFLHGDINNPEKLLNQRHLYLNWVNVNYGWTYSALADHSDSAAHTIQQMDDETGFKADLKLAAAV